MNLNQFEKNIGYCFKQKKLLKIALTHKSYSYENKVISNERLEFLGDAVLELVVSDYLYKNYENLPEGEMTKVRASVVCEKSLYEIAKKHNFGDFLFLGKSEVINNGKVRPALLADVVEAVIGAIHLDSGLEVAQKFIMDNLLKNIESSASGLWIKDYKTVLQEKLQENGEVEIEYVTIKETGPAHNKVFTVSLLYNGKQLAVSEGKTKKEAEMCAAKKVLEKGDIKF